MAGLTLEQFEALPQDDVQISTGGALSLDQFEALGSVENNVLNGNIDTDAGRLNSAINRADKSFFENIAENWNTFTKNVGTKFQRGVGQSDAEEMIWAAKTGLGVDSNEAINFYDQQIAKEADDPIKGSFWLTDGIYSVSQMLPDYAKGILEGKAIGAGVGLATAATGIGAPIAIQAGAVGTIVGSANYWYRHGFAQIYHSMNKEGIDDVISVPLSHIAGSMYGMVEFSQVDKFFPGGKEVLRGVITSSVKKTLVNYAKRTGVNFLSEITEEGLQSIIEDASLEIGKAISGKASDSIVTIIGNTLKNAGNVMLQSATPLGIMMSLGAGMDARTSIKASQELNKVAKDLGVGEISITEEGVEVKDAEGIARQVGEVGEEAQGMVEGEEAGVRLRDVSPIEEAARKAVAEGKSFEEFVGTTDKKHPALMSEEEFYAEEGRGMGVTWKNAMKLKDGRIFESNTREHGDMIQAIEDEYDIPASEMERGWTWKGFPKEQSYIGVEDVDKAGGSFWKAYKSKYENQQRNQLTQAYENAKAEQSEAIPEEIISEEVEKLITSEETASVKQLAKLWGIDEKSKVSREKQNQYDAMQSRIDEIDSIKELSKPEIEILKEMLYQVKAQISFLKHSIRRGKLGEEFDTVPKYFQTKNEHASTLDEMAADFQNTFFGEQRMGDMEFRDYIINLYDNYTNAKKELSVKRRAYKAEVGQKVIKTEKSALKQRLKDYTRGIREGRTLERKSIKEIQSELTDLITESDLTKKDQAKFIKTIKSVQAEDQFERRITAIRQRIEQLVQAEERRGLEKTIKKEFKTTKPAKVGQKRVAKYDYTTNKFIEELRNYSRLSASKALDIATGIGEASSEADLIKRRLLEYRINGAKSSNDLLRQIIKDIQTLKKAGEAAKDEADFLNKLNRANKVFEARESVSKIKANKETFKTKVLNTYAQGFSDVYSLFNFVLGKDFAEKYNTESAENAKETSIHLKTTEIASKASKIYGLSKPAQFHSILMENGKKEYEVVDKDGDKYKISKGQIIDIYLSLKNPVTKARYENLYGEAQAQSLLRELTPKDVSFAEYMQEVAQEYFPVLNQRNIEITGRDLGQVENYWPATTKRSEDFYDDIRIQGETPSAMKERSASEKLIPVPKDAYLKLKKHIAQAEHVDKVSRKYEELKRLFSNKSLENDIRQKFGDEIYQLIVKKIDRLSLNKTTSDIDAITGFVSEAINNWVAAQVALNPSTYIKQLLSMSNYIENVDNEGLWVKYFSEGISSPKETFKFMWDNAPFLEARFNRGYSEAMKKAINGADGIGSNNSNWRKGLSSLSRSGDITAIIYGGYGMIKAQMDAGISKEQAFKNFEQATLRAQQSGLSSSRSEFQNSNGLLQRMLFAFKNTSNQYMRKMVDTSIQYSRGEISDKQFAKTMTIYGFIQPTLWVMTGILYKSGWETLGKLLRGDDIDDDDEYWTNVLQDVMMNLVISPANAVPLLNNILAYASRKLKGERAWRVFSYPMFDDFEKAIQKIGDDDLSLYEYLTIAGAVIEPATAAPVGLVASTLRYLSSE